MITTDMIKAVIDNSKITYNNIDKEQEVMRRIMENTQRFKIETDIRGKIQAFESGGKDIGVPYKDNKGIWTIGFGTNLTSLNDEQKALMGMSGKSTDEIVEHYTKNPMDISKQNELLDYSIKSAQTDAESLFKGYNKDENTTRLLTDAMYNMGKTSMSKFKKTIKAWDSGDMKGFVTNLKDSNYYKIDLPKNKARYKYITELMDKIEGK